MARKYCAALGASFDWITTGAGTCYEDPKLQAFIDNLITQKNQGLPPLRIYLNQELLTAILNQVIIQAKKYNPQQQAIITIKAYEEISALSKDEGEQLKLVVPTLTTMLKFADMFLSENR